MPEPIVPISPGERRIRLLAARTNHWRQTRRVTAVLVALWLATTISAVWFARDLGQWSLFGWPLSFYMAAQGSLIVFVVQLFLFAKQQDRIDREFGVAEDDDV